MEVVDQADLSRRQFLKSAALFAVALPALPLACNSVKSSEVVSQPVTQDWAGAADGPASPSWKTIMVSASEPGEPLLIDGTIYWPDGVSPASGITLYVYHTDARGIYFEGSATGGTQKPRLRGWMRTGEDGRYQFRTIKPGPYPGGRAPMHIHTTLSGPGYPEYWIDSYLFEDDPRITAEHRSKLSGRGGFKSIIALKRDESGLLRGTRDIKLEHV